MTADEVKADLDFLIHEIEVIHPAPFRNHPREDWTRQAASVVSDAPLSASRFYVEVLRLIALAQDGHMDAYPPQTSGIRDSVPAKLLIFPNGLYVAAVAPREKRILGRRVLSIEDVPVPEVLADLRPIVPSDNEPGKLELLQDYVRMPAVLAALGVDNGVPGLQLTVDAGDGPSQETLQPSVTSDDPPVGPPRRPLPPDWVDVREMRGIALPSWQRHLEQPLWLTTLPRLHAIYLQVNRIAEDTPGGFAHAIDDLVALRARTRIDRLIIDLRTNRGGDATLAEPLVHAVIRHFPYLEPGKIFVLISNYTFSAAVHLAAELERNTQAIFVGQETAAPPNHCADPKSVTLPNSAIRIEISSLYWQKSDPRDHRTALYPDIEIPHRWSDFESGRDPALEAIGRLSPNDPRILRPRPPVFNWLRKSQQNPLRNPPPQRSSQRPGATN